MPSSGGLDRDTLARQRRLTDRVPAARYSDAASVDDAWFFAAGWRSRPDKPRRFAVVSYHTGDWQLVAWGTQWDDGTATCRIPGSRVDLQQGSVHLAREAYAPSDLPSKIVWLDL